MQLVEYLSAERGRTARVAAATSLSTSFLSQIANGVRPCPADTVPALEAICGFAVRRWDLRPNDWHRIWPELIGTEGAPQVAAEVGQG